MPEDVKKRKLGTDEMLPRLEQAIEKSGLSATAFGYMFFSDPTIMNKLRNRGRRLYKLREVAEKACQEFGV
jgi:hypothetical protein